MRELAQSELTLVSAAVSSEQRGIQVGLKKDVIWLVFSTVVQWGINTTLGIVGKENKKGEEARYGN